MAVSGISDAWLLSDHKNHLNLSTAVQCCLNAEEVLYQTACIALSPLHCIKVTFVPIVLTSC